MRTSSPQHVPLTPSASPEPADPLGLFEPIPRWELGYGNAGATEHWVDHPADVEPWAAIASSEPDMEAVLPTQGSWWHRFLHWVTH